MNLIQSRWKAILASLGALGSSLLSFYSVNQDLTLKQALAALIAMIVTGGAVHQVTNKPLKR